MLRLAKQGLDLGIRTADWDASRAFWCERLGLVEDEVLPLGGGNRQHRLGLPGGGVLKVNEGRDAPGEAPTTYLGITLARPGAREAEDLVDPDGTAVRLVPAGTDDVDTVGVLVGTPAPADARRFLVEGLEAEDLGRDRFRLGSTTLELVERAGLPRSGPLQARGLRYLTIQVHDVRAEHERLVAMGVEAPMAPTRLGDVAVISFVRDPAGGWIELSQRASLTGPLPDM